MDLQKLASKLSRGQYTLKELRASRTDIRALRDQGYRVQASDTPKGRVYYILVQSENASMFLSGASREPKEVKWVELSDVHAGSAQFDEQGFCGILQQAIDEGYEEAHISGDLTDGYKVYPGHLQNLRYWRCEDQATYLAEILLRYQLKYYACKGNHDLSYEKQGSPNPLTIIENILHRENRHFCFLNGFAGDLIICGVLKRMVHLDGGRAYAKSYPGQTYIRNLLDSGGEHAYVGGNKYRIRFIQFGHFHTDIDYEAAGIVCTHPGNFQFPNDYTIRRGLVGPQGARLTRCIIQDRQVIERQSRFVKPHRPRN